MAAGQGISSQRASRVRAATSSGSASAFSAMRSNTGGTSTRNSTPVVAALRAIAKRRSLRKLCASSASAVEVVISITTGDSTSIAMAKATP